MPDKLIDVVPPIITKLGDIRLDTSPRLERRFSDGACRGLILIVDDQADVRYLFELVLRRSGYFVRTAADGVECLKRARTMRPDLVLLNYLMPVMDGLTTLKYLKMDPMISYLKVVMFSGVGNDSPFWAEAMEAGAVCCLHTPFSWKLLVATVERCMRS